MKKIILLIKKYTIDFGLATLASVVTTVVTTLLINPILAKTYDISSYGSILTICGYVAIVSSMVGNSLNNVRLIENNKRDSSFNYNFVLLVGGVIGTIILDLLMIIEMHSRLSYIVGVSIYTLLCTLNTYYVVTYRLNINYYKNFYYNLILSGGYIVGLLIDRLVQYWPIIYIFSQFIGMVYLFLSSSLPKEGIRIDNNIRIVTKKFVTLAVTTGLTQLLSFFDRVVLYPLVGADAVSTYNTASFFGKAILTLMGPVALVLLSYYVKEGYVLTKKKFWLINLSGMVISGICFVGSIIIAPVLTKLLYPTLFDSARPYIMIANISCVIYANSVLINPAIMKLCKLEWQMIIQVIYGVVYLSLGLLGIHIAGLYGFALSGIVANTIRLIIMYILGDKHVE